MNSVPTSSPSNSGSSAPLHSTCLYSGVGESRKFLWDNLLPQPRTQGQWWAKCLLQRTIVPMGACDTAVMPMMPWLCRKPLNFLWVPARFRWDWDTPLWPTSHITHSCTGRWKGVCHHSASMDFGTQGHSIKPKGQTSPLRNEATNFERNLSVWAWNS